MDENSMIEFTPETMEAIEDFNINILPLQSDLVSYNLALAAFHEKYGLLVENIHDMTVSIVKQFGPFWDVMKEFTYDWLADLREDETLRFFLGLRTLAYNNHMIDRREKSRTRAAMIHRLNDHGVGRGIVRRSIEST